MGNVIAFAKDTIKSLVSMMGTERDKAATTFYAVPIWNDEQLVNAYRGSWLPRKIVDIPALDSCRKWRDWQADADQITAIEAEEQRLNVKAKVLEARTKARLFGGAAIYIGTGDANPMEEFRPERVKKGSIRFLNVMARRNLVAGEIETDPESDWYGKPKFYEVQGVTSGSVKIHPSRFAVFMGAQNPDEGFATAVNQGWSDSVLVAAMSAISNADSTAANIASLVFEAKVDVIRVPDLMSSLSDEGYKTRLLERFQLAATAKGINQTLLLDKEEEYEQKTASFTQLPEVLRSFLEIVAGAADIPLTRLLGTAPGGLNASGAGDTRNYYDRIQAGQELDMRPAMHRMDEAIIRSALGGRPPDVFYSWSPLWAVSETEQADIGVKNADTIAKLNQTGLFPPEALAKAAANMLTENSILPGFDQAIDKAGGLPDYEMEAEKEAEAERLRLEAGKAEPAKIGDAAPRSLYVRRDVVNKAEIIKWAKSQGFTDIVPDLHVTIAYSTTPVDWFAVGTSWSEKMDIAAGGPRQMERLGPDGEYIALLITANELVWRNKEIREAGASWSWPDYQPHISIQVGGEVDLSKVEPYQGKIVLGPEVFEEIRGD